MKGETSIRPYRTGTSVGTRDAACSSSRTTGSGRPGAGSHRPWADRGTLARAARPRATRCSTVRCARRHADANGAFRARAGSAKAGPCRPRRCHPLPIILARGTGGTHLGGPTAISGTNRVRPRFRPSPSGGGGVGGTELSRRVRLQLTHGRFSPRPGQCLRSA